MKYKKVDALAGAGKTFAAVDWSAKTAALGQKILIVQPSRILIDKTYEDALKAVQRNGRYVSVTKFHSTANDTTSNVVVDLTIHMGKESEHGEIVFCTQAAFLRLDLADDVKSEWVLIVDEIPAVDKCWDFKIAKTHALITDCVSVDDHDPINYIVSPKDKIQLRKYQKNCHKDEIYGMFSNVSACLLSDHWKVFARKENWHRYMSDDTDKGVHTLPMFAMLQPSIFDGFKEVIIMGAMFDDSLLSLYWTQLGVDFSASNIGRNLRYNEHQNGKLIQLQYCFEQDWSKRLRDSVPEGSDEKWGKLVNDAINKEMEGKEVIWVHNNDVEDDAIKGIRLPGVPNGLNEYQHIDNVVVLSALNRQPHHYAFLAYQGLDPEWVKMATGRQMAYQAMMRCSIRDPLNTKTKTVIVSDKNTAEFLAGHFPGSKVMPFGSDKLSDVKVSVGKPGKPVIRHKAMSAAEKKSRQRMNDTRQKMADLLALLVREKCHQNTISKGFSDTKLEPDLTGNLGADFVGNWSKFTYNVFQSIYSATPSMKLVLSNAELIEQLRECVSVAVGNKKWGGLISAADFDQDKAPETKRGIANINYVNGVWLDNDGGDLTPQEMRKFFPDLRFIAFNTYSGGNRWRGFIPTKSIMTVDAHKIIIRSIDAVLRERGYYSDKAADERLKRGLVSKTHGFDTSKFVASSLFYLPGQAGTGPDDSFFLDFPGVEIDPMQWVERCIVYDRELIQQVEYEQAQAVVVEEKKADIPALVQKISTKGRLSYSDWLRVTFAVYKEVGVYDGTNIMQQYFPEETRGEYAKLAKGFNVGDAPGVGTLVMLAK
jgi:hypothetical protein